MEGRRQLVAIMLSTAWLVGVEAPRQCMSPGARGQHVNPQSRMRGTLLNCPMHVRGLCMHTELLKPLALSQRIPGGMKL